MIDLALRLDSYRSHITPYGRRAWPDYELKDDFGLWSMGKSGCSEVQEVRVLKVWTTGRTNMVDSTGRSCIAIM